MALLPRCYRIRLPRLQPPHFQAQYLLPQTVRPCNFWFLIIATTITPTSTQSAKPSGVSGGAAAGIVIAVLLIVGGGAGAFFFIRHRRRLDYQRQSQSSGFGSLPGNPRYPYGTDQRLDPGMVQKRESVGSLADERDYTRKILRVCSSICFG